MNMQTNVTPSASHRLAEQAMLITLNISRWEGHRFDREMTRKVIEDTGSAADAARVNKLLVPKEALAPITTAANEIRTHFYAKTLPWQDNGSRLMPRKVYLAFIPDHEKRVAAFEGEVERFLTDKYPVAVEKAVFRMGDLFNPNDYPSVGQLRQRFGVHLGIGPVGTAGDFRVALDDATVDRIKAEIDQAADARLAAAMGDVWRRLAEVVEKFHERMSDPEAVFRNSLIQNLLDVVEMVPALNVLEDPAIEKMRKLVETKLGNVDADSIRKDPAHRQELAGEAAEIMRQMSGFVNAFGGGA